MDTKYQLTYKITSDHIDITKEISKNIIIHDLFKRLDCYDDRNIRKYITKLNAVFEVIKVTRLRRNLDSPTSVLSTGFNVYYDQCPYHLFINILYGMFHDVNIEYYFSHTYLKYLNRTKDELITFVQDIINKDTISYLYLELLKLKSINDIKSLVQGT